MPHLSLDDEGNVTLFWVAGDRNLTVEIGPGGEVWGRATFASGDVRTSTDWAVIMGFAQEVLAEMQGAIRADERDTLLDRIRAYHERCHVEHRAWYGDPEDLGRSDLWLSRAMGVSALLDHLQGEEGA